MVIMITILMIPTGCGRLQAKPARRTPRLAGHLTVMI